MSKYIIREVDPECAMLSYAFENDGLTEKGGDYCYNLFILFHNRWGLDGFNIDEYGNIQKTADGLLDDFAYVDGKYPGRYGDVLTYKECMEEWGIAYNPRRCHLLKKWAEHADVSEPADVAEYLTITTGKPWTVTSATGYCQGDYVDVVYCEEHYAQEDAEDYGEVWLGATKEFGVHELDENGEEIDSCYGYIVADCQAWKDAEYKSLVCKWAGIKEEETTLEMIDGYHTYRECTYRTA